MGIRTRRAREHHKTHFVGFAFAGAAGFFALLIIAFAFSLNSLVDKWLKDIPDFNGANSYIVAQPTTIYDSNKQVIAQLSSQNRVVVDLADISPYALSGTVDTEDIRFYQHNGVDPLGIIRAVFVSASGGREGASTITQQLVRNTILSDEQFDISLKRKVREAYIAIELEKRYTKDQILNMYLNTIYYGNNSYGIEAAANTYFSKSAKDLTLSEAALLVGIPNSPTLYNPLTNPEAATKRRNLVLERMKNAGAISEEQYEQACAAPLGLNPTPAPTLNNTGKYPYWTNYIKNLIAEDFSEDLILKGGLNIYTTLDSTGQEAAEKAVTNRLKAIGRDGLQSALVAIDPSTGYIKAMVGGSSFKDVQLNLATQTARQPGSTFKIFTLTTAIGQGMSPTVTLNCNSPLRVSSTWTVQNYGNINYGTLSLARATEVSSNTGYVQVARAIGATNIVKTAKDMGLTVDIPAYDSITLGTIGVPVIQMAEATSVLAANGVHHDAIAITKIEDRNGNVLYEHKDNAKQVVDAKVAYAVTSVLQGVVNGGSGATASVIKNYGINQPIAGKTGTTEYSDNLWFVGYTPQIACAVWTGYPDSNKKIIVNGSSGHPSNTSCPIWGEFVKAYLANVARAEFPKQAAPSYKNNSSWNFSGSSS